ncbi:hypothetical protein [Pilimelia columellifera]|uniref:Uncharacterized protein n=1 Tax=Pilimelia columellifera subsp. columellifera TaxID=706583 RepID=A0ABN3NQS9_9ACTN
MVDPSAAAWEPTLKVEKGTTVFLSYGGIPNPQINTTKLDKAASLVLRVECNFGEIEIRVSLEDGDHSIRKPCDMRVHEEPLGEAPAGMPMEIRTFGADGMRYAVEVRSSKLS